MQWNLLIYWVLVGATHALHYYDRFRERELRATQLEAELAQSQLHRLKMQLQPHFLFNALNAILRPSSRPTPRPRTACSPSSPRSCVKASGPTLRTR